MLEAVPVHTAQEHQRRLEAMRWLEQRIGEIQRDRRASPLEPHHFMTLQRRIEENGEFKKLGLGPEKRFRQGLWLDGVF